MSSSRPQRLQINSSILTQCILKYVVHHPNVPKQDVFKQVMAEYEAVLARFSERDFSTAVSHLVYAGSLAASEELPFGTKRGKTYSPGHRTLSPYARSGRLRINPVRPPSILHLHSCLAWVDPDSKCEMCCDIPANENSCSEDFEKYLEGPQLLHADIRMESSTEMIAVGSHHLVLGSRLLVLFSQSVHNKIPNVPITDAIPYPIDVPDYMPPPPSSPHTLLHAMIEDTTPPSEFMPVSPLTEDIPKAEAPTPEEDGPRSTHVTEGGMFLRPDDACSLCGDYLCLCIFERSPPTPDWEADVSCPKCGSRFCNCVGVSL